MERSKCRVIVVDDNADAADSLATVLELNSFDVRTAYDGLAGVALAESFAPNVAVLDLGLPDISGHQLGARIRQQNPLVLIVAVSGWGARQDVQASKESGFDYHFVKPAKPEELLALIDSFCDEEEHRVKAEPGRIHRLR